MQYNILRGTGLRVSELCIGTEPFGAEASVEDARKVVDMAVESGVNFIDTADLYRDNVSEKTVGEVLKGRRDKFVLATKLGIFEGPGINDRGLSRYHIIKGVEDALKRLQTDYIDLLYMHQPDYVTPMEETLEAMTAMVRSGKVRYFGVSNHAAWQMADMIAESEKRFLIIGAPQDTHFSKRVPRISASSKGSAGKTALRKYLQSSEYEMLCTQTQGSPSSSARQLPLS